MKTMFGGGTVREIQISEHKRVQPASARVGIFGTDMGVLRDGPHRIVVPYWKNQLISDLVRNGHCPRYTADTLIYQVVGDVFAGIRQTHHILVGNYGVDFSTGMKGRLMEAIGVLDQMNLLALGFREGKMERYIGDFQRMIEDVFALVGTQPHDVRKKKVVEYGERLACGRDSKGRVNPSAAMMQIMDGKNKLQSVVEDIMSIEPHIIARQQALVSIVNYAEAVITGVREFLDLLLTGDTFEKVGDPGEHQDRVVTSLGFYRQELESIDVAPYYRTCFAIREEFKRAVDDIKQGRSAHAKKLLIRSRESLKIRSIRIGIERMLMLVMSNATEPKAHPLKLDHLRAHLRLCVQELAGISEAGFALPVKQESLPHLRNALDQLVAVRSARALHADQEFAREIRAGIELL